MKKSVYKSAMSKVKTSEDFEAKTYQKLLVEMAKNAGTYKNKSRERFHMEKAKKRKVMIGWTGVAACAVLAVSIFALNGNDSTSPTNTAANVTPPPAATSTKPPIQGKVAVNIDGTISEVSADGKSFKVGDLWVTVTDETKWGSNEPTATTPSEDLLSKEFKVGNLVSGFTSQDVSAGKVNATVIYNNMAPQKDNGATAPTKGGKMAANINGEITEVSADGKSFKVGDLWVTVSDDTQLGIGGPNAAAPSEDLLQKEYKVGNFVSGFTTDDLSTGKVHAARIYNNMAPQK
ncbi:hypothetical protein A8990_12597 [Paenibacillus taihuensis]|uniref:DUF5666 domain-containing protein n=1 Tax=Paenibacillus taihuensis TaxID=1156355 RepID=A0A3D9RP79_9BACL|nr:DUF5666 domain-containing protein [Paenibacillus taihuensis]REE78700.1 hypothetical protein A8990_12597 [Paenibacillus taihuensis]